MIMNKEVINAPAAPIGHGAEWVNLEADARVRLTSEDPNFPIEGALFEGRSETGWKAATPGPQTIWLDFEPARPIERVYLCFHSEESRTHEFTLSCTVEGGVHRELLRQQYNFSPSTPLEEESYVLRLPAVSQLALTINPDIRGHAAIATLQRLAVQ
jgi:hypothetical protein